MQRKRPACESFIDDERLFKSNKTANNLGPVSTNLLDRLIKLPSKQARRPAKSAPCGDHSWYLEPDFDNPKALLPF